MTPTRQADEEHPAIQFNRWFAVGAAGDQFFPGFYDASQLRGVCYLAWMAGRESMAALAAASAPPLSPDLSAHDHGNCELCDQIEQRLALTIADRNHAVARQAALETEVAALKASPASPPRAWHPMDAAPKDGTPILCVDQNGNREIYRWTNAIGNCVEGWRHNNHVATNLTHWMPLPEPPLPFPTPPAQEDR